MTGVFVVRGRKEKGGAASGRCFRVACGVEIACSFLAKRQELDRQWVCVNH
jgi:hypothetical protein